MGTSRVLFFSDSQRTIFMHNQISCSLSSQEQLCTRSVLGEQKLPKRTYRYFVFYRNSAITSWSQILNQISVKS